MDKKKTEAELLQEKLSFSFKNQWDSEVEGLEKAAYDFNEGYKQALDQGKTEREFCALTVQQLEKAGFTCLATKDHLQAGDKVYQTVHDKGIVAAIIGRQAAEDGLLLVGSHIDSPRLDLKPNPLYEQDEQVFFKTHYYGGIKKFYWLSIPLALHGVVLTRDGKKLTVNIGEDAGDPQFTITDLLVHLSRKQMDNKTRDYVEAEQLNVLIGSKPYPDKQISDRFKLGTLQILHEKYGITERDFLSAELEVVPAHKAGDIGFDRSFVGAYGQDDRSCAWTSLQAFLETAAGEKTKVLFFTDKEEIGSTGNTGAQSQLYYFILNEIQAKMLGREPGRTETERMMRNSKMLSSDVTAAYDPKFPDVFEKKHAAYVNHGIGINKYTGGGGKGGTSDANAEYIDEITRLFDAHDTPWQISELGKMEVGGGGTIAQFFANEGMNVIDCGVPVLAMHSCFEICAKLDIYNSYRAYKTFFDHAE